MTAPSPHLQSPSHPAPTSADPEKSDLHPLPSQTPPTLPTSASASLSQNLPAGLAYLEQGRAIPLTGERKVTTKWEYWGYCIFYIGASGVGPFNFASAQFQNLLYQAFPDETIRWAGSTKTLDAFILDINGITFAIQTLCFLLIGPYSDYGNWRPYILIFFTLISWAAGFAWLGIESAEKWKAATAVYMLGYFSFNVAVGFYFAAFPGLVRDMPKVIESEREVLEGRKDAEEHTKLDMLERSKLSNLSLIFSAAGATLILALGLSIPFSLIPSSSSDPSYTTQNTKTYSILVGYFTAFWVICAVPWFWKEQYRPGQKVPRGVGWWTVGGRQVWEGCKCAWQLRETMLYLAAFFLLNDALNTSGSVIGILQNNVIQFDTKKSVGLYMVAFGSEAIGIFVMNWVQQRWGLSAKLMTIVTGGAIVFFNFWGLLGLWTTKIGYHNAWEFYAWQAYLGLAVGGWYTYSNTMIPEVVPAPKMYLFFALFQIVGKTSAFVGPFIASAIIDDAGGNTSACFWFLVFSGLAGVLLLCLVNPDTAKRDCAKYLEKEARDLYREKESVVSEEGV
ncbi:hypothetical protein L198_07814 [Cryptococcus wingfieldii CBS 7118]|uniref:Autophagy-related protein n=1 Tax=Cryptococcus wingfieldii CBS 7118 TaxID=1295528 RepID=A0A1E3HVG1_9TREE|nr:hypothetical protein L198_07814 [Cryptococcus wingfieldii CBS 7118]ODN80314.1 hypothetical protein L198_07814 [Cryptococcus wingfieldii CBS 7118]